MESGGRGWSGCMQRVYQGVGGRQEAKRQVSMFGAATAIASILLHRPAPHLPSNSLALLTGHVLRSLAYCVGEAEPGGPE